MTAASDNKFPKLIITEGTAPSSPSAGDQKLYIDSSSHHLSRKNSAGTVVDLETNQASSGAQTAHGARGIRSADVSMGNNTYTVIPFTAEDYDTDTMHDNSSNPSRFIIPSISGVTTGLWAIKVCGYTNAVAGRLDVALRKNAAGAIGSGTGLGFTSDPTAAVVIKGFSLSIDAVLSATDYVELFMRSTGGNYDVSFDAGVSPVFTIAFLGKVS